MSNDKAVREHVVELLKGKSAHIDLESALKDFPLERINDNVGGSPHTAWQLLEHIRIAQWDILDFCTNPEYKVMKWPDDYWPRDEGKFGSWQVSVKQILDDLQSMRTLVSDEKNDLFAEIPHGDGQTILREALRVSDHNSYHLGQLVLVKKMLAG
jgi:hypothetical protein